MTAIIFFSPVGNQHTNACPDDDRIYREHIAKVSLSNSRLQNKVTNNDY